jgi:hypothetical protein
VVNTLVITLPLASTTGTSGRPAENPPIELKYSADITFAYTFIKYLSIFYVLGIGIKFTGVLFLLNIW